MSLYVAINLKKEKKERKKKKKNIGMFTIKI